MTSKTLLGIVVAVVVIAGGYWFFTQNNPGAASNSEATTTPNGSAATEGDGTGVSENLALGTDSSAELGTYLIAYNGMTLYLYTRDSENVSNCTGACATAWPPYTVPAGSALNLQAGVTGEIGTITRADGTMQVTYKGQPLYFYEKDTAPGQTTGQGVGGVWYVLKP